VTPPAERSSLLSNAITGSTLAARLAMHFNVKPIDSG
jgi:hypothetical protein